MAKTTTKKEVGQLAKFDLTRTAITQMEAEYFPLKIDGIDDKKGAELVRKARADVRGKRVAVEKRRKQLKADILKRGRDIDEAAKTITEWLKPTEDHLNEQMKSYEEQIEERKKEEQRKRDEKLQSRVDCLLAVDAHINLPTLLLMTDEEFATHLATKTEEYNEEQRIAAEKRAKLEAQEKARKEQQAEAAKERERLLKQAEKQAKKEAKLKAEREKLEAEKARIKAEKQAKKDAEERKIQEAKIAEAKRKEREAQKPDREKLMAIVEAVTDFEEPDLGEWGLVRLGEIMDDLQDFQKTWRVILGT